MVALRLAVLVPLRLVDALRLAVLVPLRLAVVLVLLAVVLAVRLVVLLRLAVVAICVALLLLLSSFFIVENVFVAFEFLNSLVNVCFRFSCASALSQHHIVLGKTTCCFRENDVLF